MEKGAITRLAPCRWSSEEMLFVLCILCTAQRNICASLADSQVQGLQDRDPNKHNCSFIFQFCLQ